MIGGTLGTRRAAQLSEIGLQQFPNEHSSAGTSRSKLSKLLLHFRNILDQAVMKTIISARRNR